MISSTCRRTSCGAAGGRSSARSACSHKLSADFASFRAGRRGPVHSVHRLIPGCCHGLKRGLVRLEAGKAGLEHRPPRWVEKRSSHGAHLTRRPDPNPNGQATDVAEKLRDYERKRDPARTPEPFTSRPGRGEGPIFVVQRHDARRLHYDFRLERNGALASWAVPKGVPLEPGQRVLAVHVEDHPLDYATFEGEIPKGNYGAGTVEIWDSGTYELVEEKPDGGLTVRLHGKRLEGTWTLVPAHLDGNEKNWLLMRKRDETARAVRNDYKPMLATLAQELPSGGDWVYEVKWDGYRALGYVRGGDARLVSRNGNDLTERFPDIAKALAKAGRSPGGVGDGEGCPLEQ